MSVVLDDCIPEESPNRKGEEDHGINNAKKQLSDSELHFNIVLIERVGHPEHVYTSIG